MKTDDFIREQIAACPSVLVSFYLMASYAYYKLDKTIMSDYLYDEICATLAVVVPEHQHSHLIDEGAMAAGTGFQIKEYPLRVRGATEQFMKDFKL